jgi:hypothetical protein
VGSGVLAGELFVVAGARAPPLDALEAFDEAAAPLVGPP